MLSKETLKALTVTHLNEIMAELNLALAGNGLQGLEQTITRLGRGGKLPHWYDALKINGRMPNFDGKTVGSILEMLFVAVLEKKIKTQLGHDIPPLKINPARGVDLPDLDLGIKSPSTNFCTSEPFFTAYERLYGSEFDALIMLTDYQEAKKKSLLTLRITEWKYLTKTEIADTKLCRLALKHRHWLLAEDEQRAQRLFKFLAYVNQSDWRAVQLLKLIEELNNPEKLELLIKASCEDFERQNKKREKAGLLLIEDAEKEAIERILLIRPLHVGVIEAADSWVTATLKDAARPPSGAEWARLVSGPLDGKIGMSFALQWRYNFARIFGAVGDPEPDPALVGKIDLDPDF